MVDAWRLKSTPANPLNGKKTTSADNVTVFAFVTGRHAAVRGTAGRLIDISCLRPPAANPPYAAAAIDRWDRQTYGQRQM